VLETVPAVVVVLDAQGGVVELNRAGEELTGYSGEEIRGRKLWEAGLVPEESSPSRAKCSPVCVPAILRIAMRITGSPRTGGGGY
jgi:PAS domain S-box-containing protein